MKSASSPSTMRSVVVFPVPDGANRAIRWPGSAENATSRSTGAAVEPPCQRFSTIKTSSRSAPGIRSPFQGLQQRHFDQQHHRREANAVSQNACDIEFLKEQVQCEAH